jgi:hypothetical protein
MAEVYLRDKNGQVYAFDEKDSEAAQAAGLTLLTPEEAQQTRLGEAVGRPGADVGGLSTEERRKAYAAGAAQPKGGFDEGLALREKFGNALVMGGLWRDVSPEEQFRAKQLSEQSPWLSAGVEAAGMLPLSVLGGVGAAGAAARMGGSLAARAGAGAGLALFEGAQAEAEIDRTEGEEFNPTRAAIVGFGGALVGSGAAWTLAKAAGVTRNLVNSATRQATEDMTDRVFRGGLVDDYRIAQWAPELEADVARRAAAAFDAIEENFNKVAALGKKQGRIAQLVDSAAMRPEVAAAQADARLVAINDLRALREAIVAAEPSPTGQTTRFLGEVDHAIATLSGEAPPKGGQLWKTLDDHRRALQGAIGELEQAYADDATSAWLSREGLERLHQTEKRVREGLLRPEVWGERAAKEQAAYNRPFHEKFFPAQKVVRQRFLFGQDRNFKGFVNYRGEQAKILRNLVRPAKGDLDSYNQRQLLTQWLEGVEEIAKVGFDEDRAAAQAVLDAVKVLRRAPEVGQIISSAAERHATRAGTAELAVGALAGAAAWGPMGAVVGPALRGARVGEWLGKAARRLGLFRGARPDVEKLFPANAPYEPPTANIADDILEQPLRPDPPPAAPAAAAPAAAARRPPAAPPSPIEALGGNLDEDALTEQQFNDLIAQLKSSGDDQASELAEELGARSDELRQDGLIREAAEEAGWSDMAGRTEPAPPPSSMAPESGPATVRPEEPFVDWGDVDVPDQVVGAPSVAPVPGAAPQPHATSPLLADLPEDERWFAELPQGWQTPSPRERKMIFEAMDDLFGRRLTPQEWAAFAPIEVFQRDLPGDGIGRISAGAIGNGFELRWEYKQPGAVDISRWLRRERNGKLHMHHSMFFVNDLLQGAGTGGRALRSMFESYKKLGIDEVSVDAVDVGRWFWPSIGFEPGAKEVNEAKHALAGWLMSQVDEAEEFLRAPSTNVDLTQSFSKGGLMRAFMLTREGLDAVVSKERQEQFVRDIVDYNPELREFFERFPLDYLKLLRTKDVAGDMETNLPALLSELDGPALDNLYNKLRRFATDRALQFRVAIPKVEDLGSMYDMANSKFGREFLLSPGFDASGPWTSGKIDLTAANSWERLQGRLGVSLATMALLGLGGSLAGEEDGGGAAAAAAGLGAAAGGGRGLFAGWARKTTLFRQYQDRLVQSTVRALVAGARATPGAAARQAARAAISRAELAERQKQLAQWTSDPEELLQRIDEGLADMPGDAVGATALGSMRALSYLRERLPKAMRINAAAVRDVPVSEASLRTFALYERAALRPADALKAAQAEGRIAPETLETFEALYPDLLLELRVAAAQEVQSMGVPPSMQGRLVYAQLMGQSGAIGDPAFSPAVTAALAAAVEELAAQNAGAGGSLKATAPVAPEAPAGLAKIGRA